MRGMLTSNDAVKVRTKLIVLVLILCFAALAVRMYFVQIVRHDELYDKARSQYTAVRTKQGKRGEIFDYSGNLLVGNVPCVDISIDPQIVGDELRCRKIALAFAKRLGLSSDELYEKLMDKTRIKSLPDGTKREVVKRYAMIERKVSLDVARDLEKLVKINRIKGIFFTETYDRIYPKDQMLANILGFTNIDHGKVIAVMGLEKFFNKEISSSKSVIKYERSRDGRLLSYGNKELQQAKNGFDIYLTIREPIQAIMEEELDKLMAKWNPRAAYAVMADPETGDIIGIVQRPTYNPNDRTRMNPQAWRNRITEDIFEPGSIMKPVAVAGALDYGMTTPNERFDCEEGYWVYGGKPLRDSHRPETRTLTVSQIVETSSNIGTAKICLKMGDQRLFRTLRKFGFGSLTGVPLKPETKGLFRTLNNWDTLSITRFPIGQGIGASPLQLVRAYCALADKGRLRKLRLVDRVENAELGVTIKNPYEKPAYIYRRPETHREIIEMMKLVTQEHGTAKKAAIKGYYVAGKTGTSQKYIKGEGYSHSKFFASFIGFVPADKPAFVLLVTADEPHGNYYGGTVAAPTFKSIAERTLRYLNIKPDKPEELQDIKDERH